VKKLVFPLLAISFTFLIFLTSNSSNAQLVSNNAYVLEGSGFLLSERTINDSQIDLFFVTGTTIATRTAVTVDDGVFSIDGDDYIAGDLIGTLLRDGRFFRLTGTAVNSIGDEISVALFGRLIQDTEVGSVYSFTGRTTIGDNPIKTIFTTKVSGLDVKIQSVLPKGDTKENDIVVHINKDSSKFKELTYEELTRGGATKMSAFSTDRLTIEPGTTVTFVNDDAVTHSLESGTENYNDRQNLYVSDGRIDTGEILPGQSKNIIFEERGFYRLYDKEYPWMNLVVYSFPNIDSLTIRTGENPLN